MGPVSRVFGAAIAVGVGLAAIGAVIAAPHVLRAARPGLRAGLKRGMEAYARVRAAATEFAEDVEDLFAEVRAETERPAHGDAPRDATEPPKPSVREASSA